jgi:hypothetical protein
VIPGGHLSLDHQVRLDLPSEGYRLRPPGIWPGPSGPRRSPPATPAAARRPPPEPWRGPPEAAPRSGGPRRRPSGPPAGPGRTRRRRRQRHHARASRSPGPLGPVLVATMPADESLGQRHRARMTRAVRPHLRGPAAGAGSREPYRTRRGTIDPVALARPASRLVIWTARGRSGERGSGGGSRIHTSLDLVRLCRTTTRCWESVVGTAERRG